MLCYRIDSKTYNRAYYCYIWYHGLIDMTAYESYINGDLQNYSITDSEIEKNLEDVPQFDINEIVK